MSRPGFALSVLLVTFSGLLFAVRAANGEQLGTRVGGVKYGLCPFIGEEISDCGFGAHVCDVGLLPESELETTAPSTEQNQYWPFTSCCVSEWLCAIPARIRASIQSYTVHNPYLSGYDAAYDEVVYGVTPILARIFMSDLSPKANPRLPEQQQPGGDREITQKDWAGWDWCEGECGACVKATPAQAVSAPARRPMELEPSSIEDYYSMYGGEPRPVNDYSMYEDNYGYAPASIEKIDVVEIVKQWIDGYSMQSTWEFAKSGFESRRDQLVHRLMLSPYWSNIASIYRSWNEKMATANQMTRVRGSERSYGRITVLAVARSLDRAGSLLQNASRCLTQLVENPPAEISSTSDTSDQR